MPSQEKDVFGDAVDENAKETTEILWFVFLSLSLIVRLLVWEEVRYWT
jgi:preprotein translocase subunit SecG